MFIVSIKKEPKLIIFASGSKTGGGSGFENLVLAQKNGILRADIVAVVSNNENGGVREKADRLGIPFEYFNGPFEAQNYQDIISKYQAEFTSLSGWLKLVTGLDPKTTFNIHPGPLPRFGGPGYYGRFVHEKVMEAYRLGEVTHSGISMHFVTEKYDEGPLFFQKEVEILTDDTPETLAKRVNDAELNYQPIITDKIVNGEIFWDGEDSDSLVC